MPVAKPVSSEGRLIAHIDMDCFYVQVEQRKHPELRGLPAAVVQYNSWKGGGLIAVGYEARKFGVKRSMRGDDAKKVCPEIQLVQVPVARGKADLSTYRSAGSEVVAILSRRGRCERASIDEVYLDLTDAAETMLAESPPESAESIDEEVLKSHVLGLSQDGDDKERVKHWLCRSDADHNDKLLACGAFIVAELRAQVLRETEFTCSAGIAHNKMLAKLASGMNKPAQQTVVTSASVEELLRCLPIKKMKQLGGKLGDSLQSDLGVNTVGDLLQFSEVKLQERYGNNTGTWLWNIARGISGEEVEGRILPKSHGSGKSFPGPRALTTLDSVEHWLNELCEELYERLLADLDQNRRVAHTLTFYARTYKLHDTDSQKKFPSKSCPLRYGVAKMQEDTLNLFQAALREFMGPYGGMIENNQKNGWRITGLSISASKIVAVPPGTCSIMKFFRTQNPADPTLVEPSGNETESAEPSNTGSDADGEPSPLQGTCSIMKIFHTQNPADPTIADPSSNKTNSAEPSNTGSDADGQSHPSIKTKATQFSSHLKEGMLGSDEQEPERKLQNNQGTRSIIELLQSQAQLCSPLNQAPLPEASCSTRIENANWSGNSQAVSANKHQKDKAMHSLKRSPLQLEQGRKKLKGTSSILSFLKGVDHSCSGFKHERCGAIDESYEPSSSASESVAAATECVQHSREGVQGSKLWSVNPSDIDPTIIDELPPDIQEEVRAWLRPIKQSHTTTNRSRITGYFLPSRDT